MTYKKKIRESNPVVYQTLMNAFHNKQISHAYLFSAPKNMDVTNESMFLLELILESKGWDSAIQNVRNFSDLITIDGSTSLITKDKVLNAMQVFGEKPLDDKIGVKILIIWSIENSNAQSLNTLLKFLEEPTPNTFIIITTNNKNMVLETIKSRSQIIETRPVHFLKIARDLETENIESETTLVLARIFSSKKETLDFLKDNQATEIKNQVVKILRDSLYNPSLLFTELSPILSAQNFFFVLNLLRVFFEDVWRQNEDLPISFTTEKELLQKYFMNQVNFFLILKYINDFLLDMGNHVNFELYKLGFLIKVKEVLNVR